MRVALALVLAVTGCSSRSALAPPERQPVVVVVPTPEPARAATQMDAEPPVLIAAFNGTRQDQARLVASPGASAATVNRLATLDGTVRHALLPWRRRQPHPTKQEIDAAVIALGALKLFLAQADGDEGLTPIHEKGAR